MAQDLHNLLPALLRHVCSDSCFKYSDKNSSHFRICRHGFYHVVHVTEGCRVRRKGKALRPCIHVCSELEVEYGQAGRLRPIQLSPFECQSSFGGLVAGRHNLDLQDMRRVLDPKLWALDDDFLPRTGVTEHLGYMAKYEWAAGQYEERPGTPQEAISWLGSRALAKDSRKAWLMAHEKQVLQTSDVPEDAERETDRDFVRAIRCGVSDAFSDGINSGYYINSYTTKPGPGLAGMLEELRKGWTGKGKARIVL